MIRVTVYTDRRCDLEYSSGRVERIRPTAHVATAGGQIISWRDGLVILPNDLFGMLVERRRRLAAYAKQVVGYRGVAGTSKARNRRLSSK